MKALIVKKKWELKLKEARDLRSKGASMLFDRVSLLVECYNDPSFRKWHADNNLNELDVLDKEVSDVSGSTFLTVKAVFERFPDREDWVQSGFRDLTAKLMLEKKVDKQSTRVSWKDRALVAERENERLKAEIAQLKESIGIVAGAKCA